MIEFFRDLLGWWLAIAATGSLLSAMLYPLARRVIDSAAPAVRSLVRLAYVCIAPLAAALAVLLGSRPTLGGWLVPAHCHGTTCGQHAPVYATDSVMIVGLSALGSLVALALLASMLWALRRGRRRLRTLQAFARSTGEGYRLLQSPAAVACCTGLWRSEIILSSGLVDRLQPEELQIVLAHERAHARRMDNQRALLVRWATLAWPAPFGRLLRRDVGADAEQACDLEAVRAGASPECVAAIILRLSRLGEAGDTTPSRRAAAFGQHAVRQRLVALQRGNPVASRGWVSGGLCLAVSWFVHVYILTALSHGLIEWLGRTGM